MTGTFTATLLASAQLGLESAITQQLNGVGEVHVNKLYGKGHTWVLSLLNVAKRSTINSSFTSLLNLITIR